MKTNVETKVIQVIYVISLIGNGEHNNPWRRIISIFDFDGKLIAENDDWQNNQPE